MRTAAANLVPGMKWPQNTHTAPLTCGAGGPRDAFRNLRVNPGREMVYCLARRHAGVTLAQLGQRSGAADYAAVVMTLGRFELKMQKDAKLRTEMQKLEEHMLNVKM
jgi:hypothetical protein